MIFVYQEFIVLLKDKMKENETLNYSESLEKENIDEVWSILGGFYYRGGYQG